MIDSVLKDFGLNRGLITVIPLHQGLINNTWKISANGDTYILQKINDQVFNKPEDIDYNINFIADYLKGNVPDYFFINPVKSNNGNTLVYKKDEGYYRVFPFVNDSHAKDVIETSDQAYEAAKQFGRFTKNLKEIDVSKLRITIPSFHDLSLRYDQFLIALKNGNKIRIEQSSNLIKELKGWSFIAEDFEKIKINQEFKLRVTHHDTKLNNVLFDKNDKGICVIDLDTVMPGYFFSDVGDMMRTYLSPVSEEETDFSKIEIREDIYKGLVQGYYQEMKDELTETEKGYFFYAGTFMIYMQAIRFITDYLNDDIYYGARYVEHNLNRAKNQAELLRRLYVKSDVLKAIILAETSS